MDGPDSLVMTEQLSDDEIHPKDVRVLHVEDDETVAGLARDMLEAEGWRVETCSDGDAALEKISGGAEYDLLLVDFDLPGVSGLELVQRARKMVHRACIPIIVLSATPVDVDAREAGADAFLPKPHGVSSLVETITRLLAKGDSQTNQLKEPRSGRSVFSEGT